MGEESLNVQQSQSYAQVKVLDVYESPLKKAKSFSSPAKPSEPTKENSPLKRMGSIRKQSRLADQKSSNSPLKVFGQSEGPSPKKQSGSKNMLQKSCTGDSISLSRFEGSPAKASPLKKQMRLFEAPNSPEKRVADLSKPFASET